jgi:hypothetical protein
MIITRASGSPGCVAELALETARKKATGKKKNIPNLIRSQLSSPYPAQARPNYVGERV